MPLATQDKSLSKGFTLIELMIVIAIIAILAAILIPNFMHARAESQTAACEDNLKMLADAGAEYLNDHPASLNGIQTNGTGLIPVYLQSLPTDPASNGGAYVFSFPGVQEFIVTDSAGHDTATTVSLRLVNGNQCTACTGVRYDSASGLNGY